MRFRAAGEPCKRAEHQANDLGSLTNGPGTNAGSREMALIPARFVRANTFRRLVLLVFVLDGVLWLVLDGVLRRVFRRGVLDSVLGLVLGGVLRRVLLANEDFLEAILL